MKRIRLLIVCLLTISFTAVMLQPSTCASASLNVNKGCGATYAPGEAVTISYSVSASSSATVVVTLKVQMPNGSVTTFFNNRSISPNTTYYQTGTAGSQLGTRTVILEWEADAGMGGTDAGSKPCTYQVASSGGSGTAGSLRIYNTTSGYDIYIDGAYFATALTSTVTVPNVPAGIHQVRLTKSGCTDVVETVTIVAGSTTSIHVSMACDGEPPSAEEEEDDDGDGVPNNEDSCYNPDCNVVDSRGCPKDSDSDGVNDCDDDCPREKGSADNDGCPAGDRDSDGVPDDEDGCYNPDCGEVDAQGCPKDSDDDGLNDCEDNCPQEYGERRNDGCPEQDSDSDGVPDDQDNCYNPGCTLVDARGCPWDSDSDGLIDCEDSCPNQAGPRSNNGCAEQSQGPSFCLGTGLLAVLMAVGGIFIRMRK